MMVTGALAAPITMSSPSRRGARERRRFGPPSQGSGSRFGRGLGNGWISSRLERVQNPGNNNILRVTIGMPTRCGGILPSPTTILKAKTWAEDNSDQAPGIFYFSWPAVGFLTGRQGAHESLESDFERLVVD